MKTKICSPKSFQKSLLLILRDIGVFEGLLKPSELDRYSEACRRFVNFIPPVIFADIEVLEDMRKLLPIVLKRCKPI